MNSLIIITIHLVFLKVSNVVIKCRALVELALRDVDRFQRQKVKDLKDVFTNYAILQTEKYKKVCRSDVDFMPFSSLLIYMFIYLCDFVFTFCLASIADTVYFVELILPVLLLFCVTKYCQCSKPFDYLQN